MALYLQNKLLNKTLRNPIARGIELANNVVRALDRGGFPVVGYTVKRLPKGASFFLSFFPFLFFFLFFVFVLFLFFFFALPAHASREAFWANTGVLGENIRIRTILKRNTANYTSLESLTNVDFGKNTNCRFLQFHKRKSQTTTKMTMYHSIELIGYQIQAHWQNNCTVLNTKDKSSKAYQHFSIF